MAGNYVLMEEPVDKINADHADRILKNWLRANTDVSQREYVGVGIMELKQMLADEPKMEYTNCKVEIFNSNKLVSIRMLTTDYGPKKPFRKELRIQGNETRKWVDPWHKVKRIVKRTFQQLLGLLHSALAGARNQAIESPAKPAIGYK